MSVKAILVEDVDADGAPAGAFEFYRSEARDVAGMFFKCPCGCGKVSALSFKPDIPPAWQWDGNRESPTLTPSVHDNPQGVTHWHGFLTNGEWRSC